MVLVLRTVKTAIARRMTPEIAKIIGRGTGEEINVELDPVCNMLVDPVTAAASLEYRGKTYYFCNPGCKELFSRDPGKYIG